MSNEDPNVVGGPPPHLSGTGDVDNRFSDIFFAAVETTRMPMIVTDPKLPDHPIIFCNRAFSQMTGYSMGEIIGHNCRFLQGPETDRAKVNEIREALAESREVTTELLNYRKDGSSFWNGLYVSPILNENGELLYFFGSQLDVSRRRDAEDALRQAQKMEALGQLTGGIAHDFNNLLQIIIGYTEIARGAARRGDNDKLEKAHLQVQAAADRASALTSQLLAFARKQRLEGRIVSLNALADNLTQMGRRTLGEGVTLHCDTAPDLWNARLDLVQAETALLNIAINARDAMGGAGTLTLTTANVTVTPNEPSGYRDLAPGRYASITLADTGGGMPPEIAARVMEPFFTTKDEGKGTGLGLSMVYGFLKQSGGAVRIDSEVGRGTAITLLFPATDEAASKPIADASQRNHDRDQGKEFILVVEDRPEVAELAVSILEDYGYRCARAGNGREALEEVARAQGAVDLIFSDMVMPGGMNGVVLAREARKLQPELKVLLTTGYSEGSLEHEEAHGASFEVLSKPYLPTELARRVRLILG